MREPVFYVNGRFVPESGALVSVSDLVLLRGFGVFDFAVSHSVMIINSIPKAMNAALNLHKMKDLLIPSATQLS